MKNTDELKTILSIMTFGYTLNFFMGLCGSFFPFESFWQMTCWQIGDSAAIMGSILASRYIGIKGFNIVSSGFTLLGIAYGVSLASSSITAINEEKMATIILPLLPAIMLICIGSFFPIWLRIFSALICLPFFLIYKNVIQNTYANENLSNVIAYSGIQLLGIIWSIYIWKHYIKLKT